LKLDRRNEVPLGEPPSAPGQDGPTLDDYQPVVTRQRSSGELQPANARVAPLWRRIGASLVDAIVILAIGAAYLALATAIAGGKGPPSKLSGLDALMHQVHALKRVLLPGAILLVLIGGVYGGVLGWLWEGTTLGRRIFGLRLVDKSGGPPTPVRAIVRAVLSLFSFGFFLGGFWLALFDRRGQTLHDKLTSTFVVRPS
jgi:uncharacterized RDD family membrane protein YckC